MKRLWVWFLIVMFAILIFIVVGYIWSEEYSVEKMEMEQEGSENTALENTRMGEKEGGKIAEKTNSMPKIIDIIIEDDKCTALCEDGSVWEWENVYEKKNLHRIPNLNFIVKILDDGRTIYALSLMGDVYKWEKTDIKEDTRRELYEPTKYLSSISDIEAKNGNLFALGQDGRFYMRGICPKNGENELGYPLEDADLIGNVKQLSEGGWYHYYFIREDGSVFSLMNASLISGAKLYVFPVLGKEDNVYPDSQDIPYGYINRGIDNGGIITILYELGKDASIEKIGADAATVFLYKKDGTLWYWDSNTIKYHDDVNVLVRADTGKEDYNGRFIEVDLKNILEISSRESMPEITDICTGRDNALFLTNDGQVFMSEYVTSEIQDVAYHPIGLSHTTYLIIEVQGMRLKTMTFEKLDWENIISINTNGKYQFSAVDENGAYYYLDTYSRER